MKHEESETQQAAIEQLDELFAYRWPQYMLELKNKKGELYQTAPIYANQNAYAGNPQRGKRSVAEGVKSGVWDLTLPFARCGFNAMYIEVKRPSGRVSYNQKRWLEHYRRENYATAICRSTQEIIDTVLMYLNGDFEQEDFKWMK